MRDVWIFGYELRRCRPARGLSSEVICVNFQRRVLGVSGSLLSTIEGGKLRYDGSRRMTAGSRVLFKPENTLCTTSRPSWQSGTDMTPKATDIHKSVGNGRMEWNGMAGFCFFRDVRLNRLMLREIPGR